MSGDRSNDGLVELLAHSLYPPPSRIREAIGYVDRQAFLPASLKDLAYLDIPVTLLRPDGTIGTVCSQPSAVVAMLSLLDPQIGERILEIGGGSGYNAALLAKLVGDRGSVESLEIKDELCHSANSILRSLGIPNAQLNWRDGADGGAAETYDRILVSAGVADIADAWLRQLKPNGRIVFPLLLGPGIQKAFAFDYHGDVLISVGVANCNFIPMSGKIAWPSKTLTNGVGVWIECASALEVDWTKAIEWLRNARAKASYVLRVKRSQLGDFDAWLATHSHDLCCVATAIGGATHSEYIPALEKYPGQSTDTIITKGVATNRGIALLSPGAAVDGLSNELELTVCGGGSPEASDTLVSILEEWENAQRPTLSQLSINAELRQKVTNLHEPSALQLESMREIATFRYRWNVALNQ